MLEITGLERRLEDFSLRDISLEARPGETLVLLGPCGSGKTVLLECIAGLQPHQKGSILLNGRDIGSLSPEKRGIGFVYQNYSLFPHLTVMENITYGIRYLRKPLTELKAQVKRIIDMLQIQDLCSRSTPATLSGGEQQKIALARALAVNPGLLLLDEPLSSLDFSTRESVGGLLAEIPELFGIPVICVTHSHEEAAMLGRRVCLLMKGRILQQGDRSEVFARPGSAQAASFLGACNLLDCSLQDGKRGAGPFLLQLSSLEKNREQDSETLKCCLEQLQAPRDPQQWSGGLITLRPENLCLGPAQAPEETGEPQWTALMRVASMEDRCRFLRVGLQDPREDQNSGVRIFADLTGQARNLCPRPGEMARVSFPCSAAHFIPSEKPLDSAALKGGDLEGGDLEGGNL